MKSASPKAGQNIAVNNVKLLLLLTHTQICVALLHIALVIGELRNAAPNPSSSFFNGGHDLARKVALNGQMPLIQ